MSLLYVTVAVATVWPILKKVFATLINNFRRAWLKLLDALHMFHLKRYIHFEDRVQKLWCASSPRSAPAASPPAQPT